MFDEIQELEELILKYFNECKENFKIICAGSLLVVKLICILCILKNFLLANCSENLLEEIKLCYDKNKLMDSVLNY